jgi:hypothetical protein
MRDKMNSCHGPLRQSEQKNRLITSINGEETAWKNLKHHAWDQYLDNKRSLETKISPTLVHICNPTTDIWMS